MVRFIKKRDGLAMPLVIMVLSVLVILSTAVLGMGSTDSKHAANQSNRLQAYYLARSGADAVATYIVKNPDALTPSQMNTFVNNMLSSGKSNPFKLSPSDSGTIEVEVKKDVTGKVLSVISKGNYKGSTDEVTYTVNIATAATGFDKAIFAQGKLNFIGATIKGDIAGLSKINFEWGTLTGNVYIAPGHTASSVLTKYNNPWTTGTPAVYNLSQTPVYPTFPFPTYPAVDLSSLTNDSNVKKNGTISSNMNYTSGIAVDASGSTLTINRTNTDRIINTTNLTISNSTVIDNRTGSGKLFINVTGALTMSGGTMTLNIGNDDIIIRAKQLNLSNNSQIVVKRMGTGRLNIYIDESFQMANSKINTTGSDFWSSPMGDPKAVNIYYAGTQAVLLNNNPKIAGLFHVKQANLTISNAKDVTGYIISGGANVQIDNDADMSNRIIYAPNAFVNLAGGSKIKGLIISNTFEMSNNGYLEYVAPDQELLDFFGSMVGTTTYDYGKWK